MSLDLAPGVLIAKRYRLERALGQGGMGVVWAAVHALTQKRVALKFLKGPIGLRPELRRRFLREARAASAIVHPNVLEVHDLFELEDDTPVMLMDLLVGETLGQRIALLGKLQIAEVADVMVQVVSAVGTAHAVGVVHRDLKPENIFLVDSATGTPSVRVLDFGIAKLVGSELAAAETAVITGTGSMLGTPCYMSPEQSYGEKDVDYRTDIWSLGCIMYESLTGVRPVEGDSLGQVVKKLISERITPVIERESSVPRELADLVEQMLSADREQRPRDLRDVQEVLRRYSSASAPNFGAPVSEQAAASSGEPRADKRPSVNTKDVTLASNPGENVGRDTVESAAPPPFQGPETAGAQTVSGSNVVRRPIGTAWIVAAVLLAVGVPILATRGGSRGTTVPSAAASRTSTVAPPQTGAATALAAGQGSAAPTISVTPVSPQDDTSAARTSTPKPKQDVRTAKPAAHTVAVMTSATPPVPSASAAAAPSPRPRVGGLAEKPPF